MRQNLKKMAVYLTACSLLVGGAAVPSRAEASETVSGQVIQSQIEEEGKVTPGVETANVETSDATNTKLHKPKRPGKSKCGNQKGKKEKPECPVWAQWPEWIALHIMIIQLLP